METEGEEMMAQIAAMLLGYTTSPTGLNIDQEETQDPKNVEPRLVPLAEAKDGMSTLLKLALTSFQKRT